jgi:hypothetical protein
MRIPGFNAENALSGAGQPWSARQVDGPAAGILPAAPCCSACASFCASYPRHPWCQSCRRFCSPGC